MLDPQSSNALITAVNELSSHLKHMRRVSKFKMGAIFFGVAAYIGIASYGVIGSSADANAEYAALVRIKGEISPDAEASIAVLHQPLAEAFADEKAKAVVIVVNSPGGTPVQSALIHDRIVQLKNKFNKKTYVIGQDMLTSGAYMIAVAGDEIYVNKSTIAGSIGVISKSFGFPELLQKIGVESRTITAGENKARNDPFSPANEQDQAKLKDIVTKLHIQFIDIVKEGRKDKLKDDPNLFSGDFWTGEESVELGLVDGIGDIHTVLTEKVGVEKFREYGPTQDIRSLLKSGLGLKIKESLGLNADPSIQAKPW